MNGTLERRACRYKHIVVDADYRARCNYQHPLDGSCVAFEQTRAHNDIRLLRHSSRGAAELGERTYLVKIIFVQLTHKTGKVGMPELGRKYFRREFLDVSDSKKVALGAPANDIRQRLILQQTAE